MAKRAGANALQLATGVAPAAPVVAAPAAGSSVMALAAVLSPAKAADAPKFYQIQSILNLGGTGTSWDHIDYDQSHHRLYLSRRADGLTVIDTTTGKVVGEVANAKGSGATAFNLKADRGYTANTDGSTSVFELYLAAVAGVMKRYKTAELIPTEHAQLDDNGDGRGSELQSTFLPSESIGEADAGRGNAPPAAAGE